MKEGKKRGSMLEALMDHMGKNESDNIRDYKRYDRNPFEDLMTMQLMNNSRRRSRLSMTKESRLTDREGEIIKEGDIAYMEHSIVDDEQFVKFYSFFLQQVTGLSDVSLKVFMYLANMLEKDRTLVYVTRNEIEQGLKIGQATYYSALGELLKNNMVARGPSPIIWHINPMFAFNGNRIHVFATYERKKKLKDELDEAGAIEPNEDF